MTISRLKTNPKLRVVKETHRVVDITALLRADITERDWTAVHVNGDRSAGVDLPDRPKRVWRLGR